MPRENLLTPSTIKLFGRLMTDIQFTYDPQTLVSGYNNLLQRQLVNGASSTIIGTIAAGALNVVFQVPTMIGVMPGMTVTDNNGVFQPDTVISSIDGPGNSFVVAPPAQAPAAGLLITLSAPPNLARIYGFSFEGGYYALARPSIFLVHGNGNPVGNWNGSPSSLEQAGAAGREWDFSGPENVYTNSNIMYWEYEKGDFSIRLDTEAGPFEQILLAAALRAGADMADRSGAQLGIRSGAQLSGAQLSGAQLSGAQLSGAQLDVRTRR